MKTLGWPYPFRQTPWAEIDEFLGEMACQNPSFHHMSAIVRSVIESGSTEVLAAFTSMHDLMVVATPIPELPYDLVAGRSPGSLHPPSKDGYVLIEDLTVTGHDDRIERPVEEAVPLFWRFMIEKFGVYPVIAAEDQPRCGSRHL